VSVREKPGQFSSAPSNRSRALKKWPVREDLCCGILATFPNSQPAPGDSPKPSPSLVPATTDAISLHQHPVYGLVKTAFVQNNSKSLPASASPKQPTGHCVMPSPETHAFPDENFVWRHKTLPGIRQPGVDCRSGQMPELPAAQASDGIADQSYCVRPG